MELKLGLTADYANVAQDGKLNVMGIFGRIMAQQFPVTHPTLHLVLQFAAGPAEWGMRKKVQVKLMDQDGESLLSIDGELTVPEGRSGVVEWPQVFALQMLQFKAPGNYAFHILINQETKMVIPLIVEQVTPLGL
ncbi:MAG TPA: hypothetical protein VGN26_09075 [Armatimonadota bacterium]|jgi:hypothetical protein